MKQYNLISSTYHNIKENYVYLIAIIKASLISEAFLILSHLMSQHRNENYCVIAVLFGPEKRETTSFFSYKKPNNEISSLFLNLLLY